MNNDPISIRRLIAAMVATFVVGLGCLGCSRQPASQPVSESVAEGNEGAGLQDSLADESLASPTDASDPLAKQDRLPDGYVGTAACASCHADRHASYLRTHHSHSLSEVDLSIEPHDQTLDHPPSNRSYDIFAADGQLWHREWRDLGDAAGDRFETGRLPVRYVMGSGAFAKGYLLADGDFLLQSPVTWYVGSQSFGMAPGYEGQHHLGFTRMIHDECLFCHAGLVSRRNDNPYHSQIHELAIGCERCHGPGAEHAQLYQSIAAGVREPSADLDTRIVNPKQLDRTRAESICGQCHLHGDVSANGAGAELWSFRPGDDFAATRVHYKSGAPSDFKKAFTGHVDQMWQSQCYKMSDTLTCVTCHDPHLDQAIPDLVAYRREQCNGCHQDQGCKLPMDQRLARQQNDCIQCHMPKIGSDVPHTTTTSHWIAVYESGKPREIESAGGDVAAGGPGAVELLRRVQSAPDLSEQELARRDLLARAYWIENQAKLGSLQPLLSFERRRELEDLCQGAPSDAEIYSLLARLSRMIADGVPESPANQAALDRQWQFAGSKAKDALSLEPRPIKSRAAALDVLGNQLMRSEDYASALACFGELVRIRRSAADWYHLGICLARAGRLADAERAFRDAIRVDPNYDAPYRSLSVLYRVIDPAEAKRYAVMAGRLSQP